MWEKEKEGTDIQKAENFFSLIDKKALTQESNVKKSNVKKSNVKTTMSRSTKGTWRPMGKL